MADLQLKKVIKRFGDVQTIHGVDLDIKSGEFIVFVGPSGCGKSTLLRLVAGLEDITEGDISINGEVVNQVQPSKRGVAMVFQSYALYPHMTVFDNIAFGLEVQKNSRDYIEKKVKEVAEVLQLAPLLDRKPKELSGGQRQRVAIGRAITRDPDIFLFDEPLSNLDAELRGQMRVELAKLHSKLKTTMIYVTHDQVEAMTLADRIVVLRDGRIEQVGTPVELYRSPENRFVAGFIGSPKMNFFPGTISHIDNQNNALVKLPDGQELSIHIDTDSSCSEGDTVSVGIRPEHIRANGSGDLKLKVECQLCEYLGEMTHVFAQFQGEQIILKEDGEPGFENGSPILAGINAEHIYLFNDKGQSLAYQQQRRALRAEPAMKVKEIFTPEDRKEKEAEH